MIEFEAAICDSRARTAAVQGPHTAPQALFIKKTAGQAPRGPPNRARPAARAGAGAAVHAGVGVPLVVLALP
eukprot:COSAG04_NODE_3036_length_3250_cov_1.947636_4_plen_72_part_00